MTELSQALTLWRQTRDPRLAHVVVALGEAHRRPVELPERPQKAVQAAWLAVANEPDEVVTPLLETVTEAKSPAAHARLQALVRRGPDPRVALAAVQWALAVHYRTPPRNRPWWTLVEEILRTWLPADFDYAGLARQMAHNHPAPFTERISGRIAKLKNEAPAPSPLPEGARAQLEAWLEAFPPPAASRKPLAREAVQGLVDAVVANLDDDAPRAVLADRLIEAGDPWGDFIQAQLARTDAQPLPVDDLPEGEQATATGTPAPWLGEAFTFYTAPYYRRGFPEHIMVTSDLDKVIGEPGFRTARRLTIRGGRRSHRVRKLIQHPVCAHVRQIGDIYTDHLEWSADAGLALVEAVVKDASQELERLGAVAARIPTLEHLWLLSEPEDFSTLHHVRVPRITIGESGSTAQMFANVLEAVHPTVQQVCINDSNGHLTAKREGESWRAVATPQPSRVWESAASKHASVPPDVRRARICSAQHRRP